MAKYDYNILVIGAGSAGLVTSYIAAQINARVGLIEKHKMGGDCLNTGCVPSKALIKSAKIANYFQRASDFGFKSANVDFKFEDIMNRIQNVIKKIEPHDSVERYSELGVECIQGEAKIISPHEVLVNGKTLTAKSLVIATGARPFVPPIAGLSDVKYLTSDNLWELKTQPKKLVVLGAGPIGCELAQSFQRLGTQVTLVDMSERILPREDSDVSQIVADKFQNEGVHFLLNAKAQSVTSTGDVKTLTVEVDGNTKSIEFDEIIVAVGRTPNVHGFGLKEIGVEFNPNHTIKTDAFLRTSIKNIYACGDVAGPYQFTHMAAHQAYYACVNALFSPLPFLIPPPFNKSFKVDYSVVPWATYTDPEIATVGLSESEATRLGVSFEVTTYGVDDLDRAIADEEDHGLVKVLTKPGTDKILGATIVSNHASDLIIEFIAAMKHGFGLNKILGTIHIYPTMAEANKFLAGNWKRKNKPEGILKLMRNFFEWKRS